MAKKGRKLLSLMALAAAAAGTYCYLKKKNEEARSYMPVYTDAELEELDEDEEETDNFYDTVDYDDYDEFYDDK